MDHEGQPSSSAPHECPPAGHQHSGTSLEICHHHHQRLSGNLRLQVHKGDKLHTCIFLTLFVDVIESNLIKNQVNGCELTLSW